jgi:2-oxoglutarate ferredoxin oxidoreductase subunit gamma
MGHHEIIIAGFGGQGIMSAGNMLAYEGMMEDMNVTWYPVYGPEKRGGTAACHVIISDESVGSPILNNATALIVMNSQSLLKFQGCVNAGGTLIVDSSMTEMSADRSDINVFEIPATKIASDMGNLTYANIILLGKLIEKTCVVSKENFEKALKKALPEKYHYLIPEEMKALETGMNY